ncbi:hypothetical protein ASG82_16655 [Mycobacterium sp. Soil538]|nr:hypothetical protein ASG82_16655 [Mycobacterium sp. Soil538]
MTAVSESPTDTPSSQLTWQLVHAEPGAWVYSTPGVDAGMPALVRRAGEAWVPGGVPAGHTEPETHSALHYAGHIGRVGVLAAALGVGAAVAHTPGVAWAEPTAPDTTTSTSSTAEPADDGSASDTAEKTPQSAPEDTQTSETDTTSPSVTETGSGDLDDPTDETVLDVDTTTEPAAAASPPFPADDAVPTAISATHTPSETAIPPPAEPRDDNTRPTGGTAASATTTPSAAPAMRIPAPPDEQPTPARADVNPIPETAGTAVPAAPEAVPRVIEPQTSAAPGTAYRVLDTVWAPVIAPTTPAAHAAQTPLLWGVFAWIRRAFFNSRPTLSLDPTTISQVDGTLTGRITVGDRDGDIVTLTAEPPVKGGTIVVEPDGTFTYTAPDTMCRTGGTDTVTVTATDSGRRRHAHGLRDLISVGRLGPGHTTTLAITLRVAAQPAPTLIAPRSGTGAVSGALLVTDRDVDRDSLTYSVTGGPAQGSVTLDAVTGAFTYTPSVTARHRAAAENATADQRADVFTVTVDDGHGGEISVPVTVTIDPTNTPPTMTVVASKPDSAGTVHITVTVADPDTDPVTYLVIHDPLYGTLTPTRDGYDYTPSAEARRAAAAGAGIAAETLEFQARDAHHGVDIEKATVSISPADVVPHADLRAAGIPALMSTAVANPVTATMAGTFGIEPRYETITAPGGGTLVGAELTFNTFPSQSGIDSAYQAQGEWLGSLKGMSLEPGETPVLVSFSLSTQATVGRLRTDPESLQGIRVIMLGAPETPGNPDQGNGYQNTEGLPTTGDLSNVTMVVVQYDPKADAAVRPNYWTRLNARRATHMYGYNGLDLNTPDAVHVDPTTGVTVLYFRSDVLPMLKWLEPWVSDEKLAELDAKYRPLIEQGYSRPDGIFSGQWEAAHAG